MKKSIYLILTSIIILSASGCTTIVTTETSSYSAAQEVAEDEILDAGVTEAQTIEELQELQPANTLTDNINKTLNKKSTVSTQDLIKESAEKVFTENYGIYYEILGFDYKFGEEKQAGGVTEAPFVLTMRHKNYDKDPDTVEYIAYAKKNNPSEYKILYNEYLAEQTMNFSMLATFTTDKKDDIRLYADISTTGFPVYMPVDIFFPDNDSNVYIPYGSKKYLCSINSISDETININIYSENIEDLQYYITEEKPLKNSDVSKSVTLNKSVELVDTDITMPVNGYMQIELSNDDNTKTVYHSLYDFNDALGTNKTSQYYWIYTLYGDVYIIQESDIK